MLSPTRGRRRVGPGRSALRSVRAASNAPPAACDGAADSPILPSAPAGRLAPPIPDQRVSAANAGTCWSLLADGSLVLQVDHRLLPAAERWIPLQVPKLETTATAAATIDVQYGRPRMTGRGVGAPTLRLGNVDARVDDAEGHVYLVGRSGARGSLDLERRRSEIRSGDLTDTVATDIYAMLTVASAFMLGRLGCALLHSAAAVAPAGGAWMLVGDARAGKTTTTLNLIQGGWNYLSDDQVVLATEEDGSLSVEGWLRPFHVDAGWSVGQESARRESVDPSSLGPGRWQRRAPLAGALFLEIRPDSPTAVEPMGQADALAALVRQTPWLMADRVQAPTILALLISAIHLPTFRLSLGRDSYRDAPILLECLQPILEHD